jgi:alpha-glucosidase
MYFSKIHHPDNFRFADGWGAGCLKLGRRRARSKVEALGNDVFRLSIDHGRVRTWGSLARLTPPDPGPDRYRLSWEARGRLLLSSARHSASLAGPKSGSFGISGEAWMVRLALQDGDRFFGMGEKWGEFEKSGLFTRFYNTDVWSEFHAASVVEARADPLYASIP